MSDTGIDLIFTGLRIFRFSLSREMDNGMKQSAERNSIIAAAPQIYTAGLLSGRFMVDTNTPHISAVDSVEIIQQ